MQHSPLVKVTIVKKDRSSRCRSVSSANSGVSITRVKSVTRRSSKTVEKTLVVENLDTNSTLPDGTSPPILSKKIERPPTTVSVTHISRSQSGKSIADKSNKSMTHLQYSDTSEHCLAHSSKLHTVVPIQYGINTHSSPSYAHQSKVKSNITPQFFSSSSISFLKSKNAMINSSSLSRDRDNHREIYTIGRDKTNKNKKHQLCKQCSLRCCLAFSFALFLLIGIIIALPFIVISSMKTTVISTPLTTTTMSNTNSTLNTPSTSTSATSILTITTPTTANLSLCWNATGTTVAGITSMSGIAANQFDRPFGLALDVSNTLYISDQNNDRVQKWLMGASTGTTIAGQAGGVSGITLSDLDTPSGILVDSSGNIVVADTNNNRVQSWLNGTPSGTTIAGITGVTGSGNNDLTNPYGISRDLSSGTLYIVDQDNHRVMSYLAGSLLGTVAAGNNGQGISNTQLNYPVGVYFDSSSNSCVIANAGANNIVRWVLGASSWTLVAGSISGSSGNSSTLLDYPVGVTMDSMGNVYVADRNNHRIQLFLAGQSTGTTIAGVTQIPGNSSTLLYNPCSMTFDAQLNLYVADTYNHRIQKFQHC